MQRRSEESRSITSYARKKAISLSLKIFCVGVVSTFLIGSFIGTYYFCGQLLQTTGVVAKSLSQPMGLGGEFLPIQVIKNLVTSGNFKDAWVTTAKGTIHVDAHNYIVFPKLANIVNKNVYWSRNLPHIVISEQITYHNEIVGTLYIGYQIPLITIIGFALATCLVFTVIALYLYLKILALARNVAKPFREYSDFLNENVGDEYFFESQNNWNTFSEINTFNKIIVNYINKSKLSEAVARKAISKAQIAKIASRVKHDVIASLDIGESALDSLKNESRQVDILRTVFERIYDTVEDIPKIGSLTDVEMNLVAGGESIAEPNVDQNDKIRKCHIISFIHQIIGEIKLSKICQSKKIKFRISCKDDAAFESFSEVAPNKFKRDLLNLYKNSIDAILRNGIIKTEVSICDEMLKIVISDNGKGIPSDILPLLGCRGATFNKANGTGIGLSSAIEDVERWNGKLNVKSEEGIGTSISMMLPRSDENYLYPTNICLASGMTVVVIDDDPIVHNIWKSKFEKLNLGKHSITVNYFLSLDTAKECISSLEKNNNDYILLIDNDLRHPTLTGISFIIEQKIESKSILVTSNGNSNWLHEECMKINLAVLPKSILERIPVQVFA